MINPIGIDHLVLRTAELRSMLAFYCTVLGGQMAREVPSIGLYQVRVGRSLVDLVDVDSELGRKGGPAPKLSGGLGLNLDHFCLRVEPFDEGDIRAHLERHDVPAGPVERRHGAEGIGPSMYIQDPDGNTVELKGPPEP